MAYTDIDDPSVHFQVKAYAGTGSSNAVTYDGNSDMQPDLLWFKNRQQALNWMMWDSVRGITKYFYSNLNEAEGTTSTVLTAIGSDGFTVGANNNVNQSSNNIINYGWKAGSGTSTNTAGNGPDTTINVNQTAGFSIVTWTGNGDAHTFGHGLGANADVVIVKNRGSGSSSAWYVNHISVANTKTLFLNTTAAETTNGIWGNSAPDSTTFKFDTDNTDNFVAYCFSEVKGYSKFSSYTGNGNADGTFVYTGFKPAFVITKCTDASPKTWVILDNKRDSFNLMNKKLFSNNSDFEYSGQNACDFLSNGFKLRDNSTNAYSTNHSGGSFIYMAFAENPFVTSTSVPATAR